MSNNVNNNEKHKGREGMNIKGQAILDIFRWEIYRYLSEVKK